jgi:hypothetical protein
MAIDWTKDWSASDDGTIISGRDIRTIQDDISAVMVTTPIADSNLAQITTTNKVHASALTGMLFWEDTLISYENELLYLS